MNKDQLDLRRQENKEKNHMNSHVLVPEFLSSPVSKWFKAGGIILGILFSALVVISVMTIPAMKIKTVQAVSLRNEMLEQIQMTGIQIEERKRIDLESALYQLFDPIELYSTVKNHYDYAIKVNGKEITKNNVLFNIKESRCVIELMEKTNNTLIPQEILSDISPFSGNNHLKDPAFSVFTTSTPFKYSVSNSNGKTVETYLFDDIKVGEIFTIKISNPIIKEILGIGTGVVEITHT